MNKVILTNARLVRDVELKSAGELQIAKFTVAMDRQFDKDKSDFINCVAFGKRAETIEKFFSKGSLINIEGKIQTGSYEKDGRKIYTFDVAVDNFEFLKGSKKEEEPKKEKTLKDEFLEVVEYVEGDELPF